METDDEKFKDTQSKNYELQMWKEENQALLTPPPGGKFH